MALKKCKWHWRSAEGRGRGTEEVQMALEKCRGWGCGTEEVQRAPVESNHMLVQQSNTLGSHSACPSGSFNIWSCRPHTFDVIVDISPGAAE